MEPPSVRCCLFSKISSKFTFLYERPTQILREKSVDGTKRDFENSLCLEGVKQFLI